MTYSHCACVVFRRQSCRHSHCDSFISFPSPFPLLSLLLSLSLFQRLIIAQIFAVQALWYVGFGLVAWAVEAAVGDNHVSLDLLFTSEVRACAPARRVVHVVFFWGVDHLP